MHRGRFLAKAISFPLCAVFLFSCGGRSLEVTDSKPSSPVFIRVAGARKQRDAVDFTVFLANAFNNENNPFEFVEDSSTLYFDQLLGSSLVSTVSFDLGKTATKEYFCDTPSHPTFSRSREITVPGGDVREECDTLRIYYEVCFSNGNRYSAAVVLGMSADDGSFDFWEK